MKNVQISQELFFLLVRYFLIGQEETEPEIAKALEKKMDALVMRELYTQYKTAPTEEEKEKEMDEVIDQSMLADAAKEEGEDGMACAVSFYMRLDGTEWNEELEELPPRYEEYKAALANK